MKRQKGMTLIEITVGVAAMALLTVGIAALTKQFLNSAADVESNQLAKSSTQALGQHILRVGRLAGASPTGVGPTYHSCSVLPDELVCEADLNTPPNGSLTTLRFRFDSVKKVVYFETQLAGPPISWRTDLTYENIVQFDLCGDAAGCALFPTQLSTRYQAFLTTAAAIEKNRFFRFRIRGVAQKTDAVGAGAGFIEFQSAFYVRNPPSFNPAAAFPMIATGM